MTRAQQRAFDAGRLAYRQRGSDAGTLNTFRNAGMRGLFLDGVEHERQLDRSAAITPEQDAEYAANLDQLKAFAKTL